MRAGLDHGFDRLSDRTGGSTFLGQYFDYEAKATQAVVPAGASYVFAEAVGCGGLPQAAFTLGTGSAGASDGIFAVEPGQTISYSVAKEVSVTPTTVTIAGQIVLSAGSSSMAGVNGTGKYPGTFNRAGGRLGGPRFTNFNVPPGIGGGAERQSSGTGSGGGTGAVCLSYFGTYDAALAFANSLYNGAWVP